MISLKDVVIKDMDIEDILKDVVIKDMDIEDVKVKNVDIEDIVIEDVPIGNRNRNNSVRNRFRNYEIGGYLTDELKEKYSKEFLETRQVFLDEYWNKCICKGKGWFNDKKCVMEDRKRKRKLGKVIYVDGAKMTNVLIGRDKVIHYNWESIGLNKFTEEWLKYEIEADKLDKSYKQYGGYYVVLCCKELGLFVFTATEFLERVLKVGKPSQIGYIHWNVKSKKGGKEIWLVISGGGQIDITTRRNVLDILRD